MTVEEDLVRISVFLALSFGSGKLVELLKISPIVAFIVVGALLGPPLADFIPSPDGVALAGLLGIQLSVVDAGIGTNLHDLRKSAARAILVAVLGVVFPIAGACLVISITHVLERSFESSRTLKTAFAVGSAIAPTSLGVTARLLADVGELETKLGQLVSIAAVFDDVISLILLSQVVAISGDSPSAWELTQPILFSVIFITGSLIVAACLPWFLENIFKALKLPQSILPKLGLWTLMGVVTGMTFVATKAKTSFLLAGYLTGVAFANVSAELAADPWKNFVVVHIEWLSMLFFAGTIGFVIPLRDLFAGSSLGIGALLALVGVFGKLLCGLGLLPNVNDGIAVGVAMLGRGEFGFLIAAQARSSGLLDDRIYAATVWGVLVPTLVTPLVFGPVFRWRAKFQAASDDLNELSNDNHESAEIDTEAVKTSSDINESMEKK